jgi:hypothetical protein
VTASAPISFGRSSAKPTKKLPAGVGGGGVPGAVEIVSTWVAATFPGADAVIVGEPDASSQ